MSKPEKLLKKIIIAIYCEDKDWSNNAKIGVFMNSLLEKPVLEFTSHNHMIHEDEKTVVEKIKKLMTDNYRWEIIFSQEIKVLKLIDRTVYFLDPKNYASMNDLQYQF